MKSNYLNNVAIIKQFYIQIQRSIEESDGEGHIFNFILLLFTNLLFKAHLFIIHVDQHLYFTSYGQT